MKRLSKHSLISAGFLPLFISSSVWAMEDERLWATFKTAVRSERKQDAAFSFRLEVEGGGRRESLSFLSWRSVLGKEANGPRWEKVGHILPGSTVWVEESPLLHLKSAYKGCLYDFWLAQDGALMVFHLDPGFNEVSFSSFPTFSPTLTACPPVVLESNGAVVINQWVSQEGVTGKSHKLVNLGLFYTGHNLSWQVGEDFANLGKMGAQGDITLKGKNFKNAAQEEARAPEEHLGSSSSHRPNFHALGKVDLSFSVIVNEGDCEWGGGSSLLLEAPSLKAAKLEEDFDAWYKYWDEHSHDGLLVNKGTIESKGFLRIGAQGGVDNQGRLLALKGAYINLNGDPQQGAYDHRPFCNAYLS